MKKFLLLTVLLLLTTHCSLLTARAQGTPGTVRCPTQTDTLDSLFRINDSAHTILSGAVTSSATTITVTSTATFPSSGSIKIDSEVIYYTGKTSTTFTGLARGASGTSAASHANSALVNSPILAAHHNALAEAVICAEDKALNAIPLSYLDTDGAMAANSDLKIASQKAAKTYADTKVPSTRTINGHALNANVTVTPSDLTQDSTHRFTTDAEKSTWNAAVPNTRTVNGHQLNADVTVTPTDLGLVIGTNVEAYDLDLLTIAGIAPSNDDLMQRKAGAWVNRTPAQLKVDLAIAETDVAISDVITNNASTSKHGFLKKLSGNVSDYLGGDGNWNVLPAGVAGANPTAAVGLTAINGSAPNFMRSDAAPPIDQAIAPTWSGVHNFASAFTLSGTLSPAALSSDVNDYSPTSMAGALALRVDGGAADRNITGLAGGSDGRILTITNIGSSNNLVVKNQSTSSSAANRFLLAADTTLPPDTSLALRYDATSGRWRAWSRALANTGVTAGSYGSATQVGTFTVDSAGRLTAASNTTITPAFSSLTAKPTTLSGYGITDAAPIANPVFTGTGTIPTLKLTGNLVDTNSNELFKFSATASAVNELTAANAATGTNPTITASGDDANIGMTFASKGTGSQAEIAIGGPTSKAAVGQWSTSAFVEFRRSGANQSNAYAMVSNGTDTYLNAVSGGKLYLVNNGTAQWYVDGTGLVAQTDNAKDIGASGANRPRTGYFGTSVVTPTLNATTALQINGTTVLSGTTLGSTIVASSLTGFGASPILTNPIIANIYGSSVANGDITIQPTSNATIASSYIFLPSQAGVLIGSSTLPNVVHALTVIGDGDDDVIAARGNSIFAIDNRAIDGTPAPAYPGGMITFGGRYTNGPTGTVAAFGAIQGVKKNLTDSNRDAQLNFYVRTEGDNNWTTDADKKMVIDSTGVIKIGGSIATRSGTEGTNRVDIYNGTAPVGTLTNGISLYSTAGELRVMDAAGNATLLSPHDHATNEWIFYSQNTVTGKVLKIDMERMLRFLNHYFETDFVHEYASEEVARPDLRRRIQ